LLRAVFMLISLSWAFRYGREDDIPRVPPLEEVKIIFEYISHYITKSKNVK